MSARENHLTRKRVDAEGREKYEALQTKPFSLPPRLAFLGWGDFHPRSRFACSAILRENEGLLVVYNFCSSTMTGTCCGDNTGGILR